MPGRARLPRALAARASALPRDLPAPDQPWPADGPAGTHHLARAVRVGERIVSRRAQRGARRARAAGGRRPVARRHPFLDARGGISGGHLRRRLPHPYAVRRWLERAWVSPAAAAGLLPAP